jgi:hypothetical protein
MRRITSFAGALACVAVTCAVLAPAAFASAPTLTLSGTFPLHHQPVTVPHRAVELTGVVTPFVAGQWVEVRSFLGHRLVKSDHLRIKPQAGGGSGAFTERVASPGAGPLAVRVVHAATPTMPAFDATRRVSVLDEQVGFGSTGRFVQLLQQRLAELHFYIPQTGVYDAQMGLAIDAYHRLLGWGTSQLLDGRTISYLLDGFGQFKVRFASHGAHAEGDLTHQLLALIDGAKVKYILPISSGKPSTPTILGDYRIYSRVPGYLPDGMYYSDFFIRGYAIHGYDPAPDYPASHGCMRLPISDAIFVFNWLALGDWVDSYYR